MRNVECELSDAPNADTPGTVITYFGQPYERYLTSVCRQWRPDELVEDKMLTHGADRTEIWHVHAKTDPQQQQPYVLKLMNVTARNIYRACNEAKVLSTLQPHPHILRLFGWVKTSKSLGLLLEYAAGGDLSKQLKKSGQFTPLTAAQNQRCWRQLTQALAWCHAHDIAHLDLKPRNVLLDANGNVKLADFGGAIWVKVDHARPEVVCSYTAASPEVAESMLSKQLRPNVSFTTQSDMWSLGVLMFEMCCGHVPFWERCPQPHTRRDLKLVMQRILKTQAAVKTWPPVFGEPAFGLVWTAIKRLLRISPKERPTAAQLLAEPWLAQSQ